MMTKGKRKIKCLSVVLTVCIVISLTTFTTGAEKSEVFDVTKVPTPIFDQKPGYVELYWRAWEMAYDHVVEDAGVPHNPYMDEVCYDNVIWIWDSCFMTLFNKYASNDYFPGIDNLINIYAPLYDEVNTTQSIWFVDNPNLLAWVEWENYLMSGDIEHVKWLINEKQYLQKHYMMLETAKPGDWLPNSSHAIAHERTEYGYTGSNQIVGMDNSPRGRTYGEQNILWIDTISQQALSAYYISKLADVAGNAEVRDTYAQYYENLKFIINQYYWDETDGFYYDINKFDPNLKDKVKTVASFWPMLACVADNEKAARLLNHVNSDSSFGGFVDFPSVARDDPDFDSETGAYWRGGLWLPTAYMGIKGLENYGFIERADEAAEKILEEQYQTYVNVFPHTIWETYAPCSNEPSTEYGNLVRQDFCGWSALGPISLFIENVLGFHTVDAINHTIEWRLHQEGRNGITNLAFGDIITDIVYNDGVVTVRSNANYTLYVNDVALPVGPGVQSFTLDGETTSVPEKLPFDPTLTPVFHTNIARNKPSTASSSQNSGSGPEKGNDGNQNSMWIANNDAPGNWWMVDLEKTYRLTGGSISFEADALWKYHIDASLNGEDWVTLVDRSQNTESTQIQSFDADMLAQYVRVTIDKCPGDCWSAFREFELYGSSVMKNLAEEGTASASSFENQNRAPSYGNDGDLSTMWIAANGDSGNWWMVDLGNTYKVCGSKITFEKDGQLWQYYIEVSSDGSDWTTVADYTGNALVTQIQEHKFSATARYVRITFTSLPYDCWVAFREFEVYGTE